MNRGRLLLLGLLLRKLLLRWIVFTVIGIVVRRRITQLYLHGDEGVVEPRLLLGLLLRKLLLRRFVFTVIRIVVRHRITQIYLHGDEGVVAKAFVSRAVGIHLWFCACVLY